MFSAAFPSIILITCLTELYLPVIYLLMTVFCIDKLDPQKPDCCIYISALYIVATG